MEQRYKPGMTVFGSWVIHRKLGEGSFGQVFEIRREDFGEVYKAALKIITVPSSPAEVESAMAEGMSGPQAEQYFYGVVEDIVREFAIMAKLKGTANVVGYEDHAVVRHKQGIGWDIFIRMELLNPLLPYAYAHPFARRDIIRLGIDLCRALELCQKYNIIHRDIKPENIFVSDNGDFKLGDFGIARTIDRTMSGLSKKGTYNYMAPEVYRGGDYGFSVDIYSLGVVLYRLLNRNRVPFLPAPPAPITFQSREQALAKRMGGEPLPPPVHGEGRLGEIVLKACSFDPKDRYSSPARMRQELEAILYDEQDAALIYPDGDELALVENQYASTASSRPEEDSAQNEPTASVFGGGDTFEDSRTESMFGGDAFEGSRTESMFGGATQEEATSRTESIFGSVQQQKKSPDRTAVKGKKPTSKKAVIVAAALAVLLAAGAGGGYWMHLQQQQRNAAEYARLMEEGLALCESAPADALDLFEQAQTLAPDEVEPKISRAYALYLDGQYEACVSYIEDDLGLGKAYDTTLQSRLAEILGAAYFEMDDYAAAASFFRLSTAGGDITVAAQRDYAVSLGHLGDFEAADQVLAEMIAAGASDDVTAYVQAEVDYARGEYASAESGFHDVLEQARDPLLQRRALRSLAEVYRDCADLGDASPLADPAASGVTLLTDGISRFSLQYDSTLWEMLGEACFQATQAHPDAAVGYLEQAAQSFEQVLALGVQRDYLYANLYSVYYQLGDYQKAAEALNAYKTAFPEDYLPYAFEGMLYITMENEKPQDQRDYSRAVQAYDTAGQMLRSDDDQTYYQQLGNLIDSLRANGWL